MILIISLNTYYVCIADKYRIFVQINTKFFKYKANG